MSRHFSYNSRKKTYCYATAYFMFLVLVVIFSTLLAASGSDPIVLGTEMNTNGMVEYLCLGKGCEDLP